MFARIRVYPQNNSENDAGCTLVKPWVARIYLPIIQRAAFLDFSSGQEYRWDWVEITVKV
jgi:hypothetical protein